MSTTYIIQVFLDADYMFVPAIDESWVEKRIAFFERYTLRSILAQNFSDFRLFLLCSEKRRSLTSRHQWHDKVELHYDLGRSAYEGGIDSDYVSITRIDSDDLFHTTAMEDVRRNQLQTKRRECLIFRKCLRWDMVNRYLGTYHRGAPPYYTHIFPKALYKDWHCMLSQHFLTHGKAGGRLPDTIELPKYKVCVVKHDLNHQIIKPGAKYNYRPPPDRKTELANEFMEYDRKKIIRSLADFGVREQDIALAEDQITPHLKHEEEIKFLGSLINKGSIVLEFGSGRSTAWFADRAKRVFSLEDQIKWFDIVTATLRAKCLNNVALILDVGYSKNFKGLGQEFDLIYIDPWGGILHGTKIQDCIKTSYGFLKKGGYMVFGDRQTEASLYGKELMQSLGWERIPTPVTFQKCYWRKT